ncbi:MAG: uncharacterized protein H6R27_606 [Proteobacteria bacterium]|nr:uncharacterized protein [Pseudomonadota bacterium]
MLIAGLLVSLAAQPQEIYRWVDKDGIVHYADQPGSPDAVRVPYHGGPPSSADAEPPALYESDRQDGPPTGPTYESLRIISPAPDEVFFGGDVSVNVQLDLDRDLRPGDTLVVFVDGQRAPAFAGLSTTITGLARGTHFLRAAVTDEAGSVVITSPQINFHLRQESIAQPPTGPTLRPPPPKPKPKPATPPA